MDFDFSQEAITPDNQPYIKINTTGALGLPVGNTGQRPGSPDTGFLRYNTDAALEYWDGAAWTAVGGGSGGPNSYTATASTALTAGQFVSLWDNGGTLSVRPADSSLGYEADGYVTASYSSSATATVYTEGSNNSVTGATVGPVFLSTSGGFTSSMPSAPALVQVLGFASSSSSIKFLPGVPVQT